MTKLQFILSLNERLSALPASDAQERLNFYTEMIEDRMEEGLSEEEAVAAVGSVDQIARQILEDFSLPLTKDESKSNAAAEQKPEARWQLRFWEIILLVLGSPLWLSLLIAVFSVILSLYVSVWAVIASLWAVFAAVAGSGLVVIISGSLFVAGGYSLPGLALIGTGIACAGLSILLFFGCKAATNGAVLLTKKTAQWVRIPFRRKEVEQ